MDVIGDICEFELMTTTHEMINTFIFLLHILPNIVGLFLNAVLFILARYRSPHTIKKYSVLILNFAVCDFFACLTSLFVCQRIIPCGTSLFYCSEGPCQYFGARVCYVCSLPIVVKCSSVRLAVVFFFGTRVIFPVKCNHTVIAKVAFSFADDPPEQVEPLFQAKYPHYNLTGQTITGNINVFEWKALGTILHMTLPITPVYFCILVLRRKIICYLNMAIMSTKTKLLHHQLLTALSWQACLPLFYLYSVLSYALGQLGVYHHPYMEHSTFISVGFIPALSPLASLYFVRPYRECIRKFFLCSKKRSRSLKETSEYLKSSHSSKFFHL
ncbi:7TM chemoreceptor [Necator americanus]|uniref:7TM chemoreceptor n=1 Tax=Necator americanus TaxID=51031 RepID=W2TG56_NECAM|nr:7TM chemoreceptor [Necator americanus]ETN80584.1 7TM chemoreceptor [Necator americanus]